MTPKKNSQPNARLLSLIEQVLEITDQDEPSVVPPFPSVSNVQRPVRKFEEAPRRRNAAHNQDLSLWSMLSLQSLDLISTTCQESQENKTPASHP
jgi:hypothetical protein